MATATSPPTPQAPDLPAGVFPTLAEAIAHAQRAVELNGGGTPIYIHRPDGTVLMAGLVMEPPPSPAKVDVPLYAPLDEKGRLLPEPEEVRAERLRRTREAHAKLNAEPATPEEVEAELEELREIDRERAARGARPLFEGA
jgi:hypothetical protein